MRVSVSGDVQNSFKDHEILRSEVSDGTVATGAEFIKITYI